MTTAFQSNAFQNNAFQIDVSTSTGVGGSAGKKRRRYERLRGKVSKEEFRLAKDIIERIDREEPQTQAETRQIVRAVVEKETRKQIKRARKPIFPAVEPVVSRLEELILPLLDEPLYEDLVGVQANLLQRKKEEEWLILLLATMR